MSRFTDPTKNESIEQNEHVSGVIPIFSKKVTPLFATFSYVCLVEQLKNKLQIIGKQMFDMVCEIVMAANGQATYERGPFPPYL
jgi:hypothetical protein